MTTEFKTYTLLVTVGTREGEPTAAPGFISQAVGAGLKRRDEDGYSGFCEPLVSALEGDWLSDEYTTENREAREAHTLLWKEPLPLHIANLKSLHTDAREQD